MIPIGGDYIDDDKDLIVDKERETKGKQICSKKDRSLTRSTDK